MFSACFDIVCLCVYHLRKFIFTYSVVPNVYYREIDFVTSKSSNVYYSRNMFTNIRIFSKHVDKIKIPKQVLCVFPTTSSVRLNYYH